jgi:8-oxo-dGTP diphosphatase
MRRFLHKAMTLLAPLCFNLLNVLLAGNLPPLAGACVVVEEQGRFLLVRQANGKLSFPGGFVRWREHPAQTARRECIEETGLDVDLQDAIGTYVHISTHPLHISTINIAYAGKLISGGRLRGSIEGQPVWMSEADVCEKLVPHYPNILEDYFAHRKRTEADSRA